MDLYERFCARHKFESFQNIGGHIFSNMSFAFFNELFGQLGDTVAVQALGGELLRGVVYGLQLAALCDACVFNELQFRVCDVVTAFEFRRPSIDHVGLIELQAIAQPGG